MQDNEELLYIEDANKQKLFYRFTPAALISNFTPLLVLLDNEGEAVVPNFEYKMWNILRPLDNFGYENKDSYWLGEKGNFFVKDLLPELIAQIAEEYECEDHIYMYGSGRGGYGAILHGILCKANAVYASAPQIRLKDIDTKENDLSNFLNPKDGFPIFYLCNKADTDGSTMEDETVYFVEACKKHEIKVDLKHCPKPRDNAEETLKEVLSMLERMSP